MKTIGQILLWTGFLSGALATVFHAPPKAVKALQEMEAHQKMEPTSDATPAHPDLSAIPVPEDGWHLIPWTWYGVSCVLCFAGVVTLHASKKAQRKSFEKTRISMADLTQHLSTVIEAIEQLQQELETLPPSQMVARIDGDMADELRLFAEGRESITAEFGLNVFADVMTDFAAGERAINRAWSASADGYVDETALCLTRARAMLESARHTLVTSRPPQSPNDK